MQYQRAIVPGGIFFFTLMMARRRPSLALDGASMFGRFVKAGVYASDWRRDSMCFESVGHA
ncbi:hypothetical protein [Zoogloea sp.]|uniref:hypothetical protein n=1 Tax=Zoogloea sp. TaxID=49181 RepID=UPI002637B5F2|nr:hypothetical protein [Zoogloea sp.]